MKRTLHWSIMYWLLGIMLVISMASCQKDNSQIDTTPDPMSEQMKKDIEVIAAMGYNTNGIFENDEYYVVEGDILIKKESLAGCTVPQTRAAYYYPNNLVSYENWVISIKTNFPSYVGILKEAVIAWNRISNYKLGFNYRDSTFPDDGSNIIIGSSLVKFVFS